MKIQSIANVAAPLSIFRSNLSSLETSFTSRIFWSFFASVLFIILFIGCEDDKVGKQVQTPEITFEQSGLKYFSGVKRLVVNASEAESLSNIAVYVDGELIIEEQLAKPKSNYEFTWDTESVADGEHEIIIVVTDVNGEEITQTYPLTVRNVLMKFICESGSLGTKEVWAFLSDSEGACIGIKQLTNDTEVVIKAPEDFQEDVFTVSTFTKSSASMSVNRGLKIVTNQKPGEKIYKTIRQYPQAIGSATVRFSGVPNDQYFRGEVVGNNVNVSSPLWNVHSLDGEKKVELTAPSSDVLIVLCDMNNPLIAKYKYIENISVNSVVELSLSELSDFTVHTLPIEFDNGLVFSQSGVINLGGADERLISIVTQSSKQPLYVSTAPDGLFDGYYNLLYYGKNGEHHEFEGYLLQPLSTWEEIPTAIDNISANEHRIKCSVTNAESIDKIKILVGKNVKEGDTFYADYMEIETAPNELLDVVIPDLPDQIYNQYFNTRPWNIGTRYEIELAEYEQFDNFDDFIKNKRNSHLDFLRSKTVIWTK